MAEFVAEEAVETLLSRAVWAETPVILEIANAALLALLVAPIIWWFAVRPLHRIAMDHAQAATVLTHAADGIITINAQGLVESLNEAAEHIFEYTAGEVIGKPVTLLMPERYRDAHHRGIDRVRAGVEPCLLGKTGIDNRSEILPRLFQEFVQLEATATMHHDGTGLGLALTKRLVELHGGWLWAESDGEGRGRGKAQNVIRKT